MRDQETTTTSTPECFRTISIEVSHKTDKTTSLNTSALKANDTACSVLVAVRVRPFSENELEDKKSEQAVTITSDESEIQVVTGGNTHSFSFDYCFNSLDEKNPSYTNQQRVYNVLAQPLLKAAFEGYNTCLFAYGQTGSGKSYSIIGHKTEPGVLPRFCEDLFTKIHHQKPVCIEISYFEIYNEKIHDLLVSPRDEGKNSPLRVREHPVLGPYVEDLSTYVVSSFLDIQGWLSLGNKRRATAATGMNSKSSRSHSVFTILITQTEGTIRKSKVNLIDLAGSERAGGSHCSLTRLKEGANINKSLLTLGKVISRLAEAAVAGSARPRKRFVPYRESVLTYLLKESLGGNSRTAMIATVSPASSHVEETLSTLRYAKEARKIVNTIHVNEDPKAKLIQELRAEIARLQQSQQNVVCSVSVVPSVEDEIAALKRRLEETETQFAEASRTWQQKLEEAEAKKIEESKLLEKAGISLTHDNHPHLVNLNEDSLLSEVLLYVLREGETRVGRNAEHEIQLRGRLIAQDHCVFVNDGKVIKLYPREDASSHVNGHLITESTVLHHGDRIVLGDHYFRMNHPTSPVNTVTVSALREAALDFHFARRELLQVQDKRIDEEVKARERQQMENELSIVKSKAEEKTQEYEERIKHLTEALHKKRDAKGQSCRLGKNSISDPLHTNFVKDLESTLTSKTDASENWILEAEAADKNYKLYELSLMVKEANLCCVELHKDLVFSWCHRLHGDSIKTEVHVLNTKQNRHTHWGVDKFKLKVLLLRDNAQDTAKNKLDIFSVSDVWETEDSLLTSLNKRNSSSELNLTSSSRFTPTSENVNSNILRRHSETGPCSSKSTDQSLINNISCIYKSQLTKEISDTFNVSWQRCGTTADRLIVYCGKIKAGIGKLSKIWICQPQLEQAASSVVVELKSYVDHLVATTISWLGISVDDFEYVQTKKDKAWNYLKEIVHEVALIFQGIEKNTGNLFEKSVVKTTSLLSQFCVVCGELAASRQNFTTVFQTTGDHCSVDNQVKGAFMCGVCNFLDMCLDNSVKAVGDKATWINSLLDESYSRTTKDWHTLVQPCQEVLATVKIWVHECRSVQSENAISSPVSNEVWPTDSDVSYDYVKQVTQYLQRLVTSVDDLTRQLEKIINGSIDVGGLSGCNDRIKEAVQVITSIIYNAAGNASTSSSVEPKINRLETANESVCSAYRQLQQALVGSVGTSSCAPDTCTMTQSTDESSSMESSICTVIHDSGNDDRFSMMSQETHITADSERDGSYSIMVKHCFCSPTKAGVLKCEMHQKDKENKSVRFNVEKSSSLFSSFVSSTIQEDSVDI